MTDLVELRRIISELGYCRPDASLEFMALIPGEVRAKEQALSERIAVLRDALVEARIAVAADIEEAECGDDGRYASFLPVFVERLAKIDAALSLTPDLSQ